LYVDTLGIDTVWKWAVLLAFDRNPQSWNEQRGSMPFLIPLQFQHRQIRSWSTPKHLCGLNQ
jgi:hypothetical protein